MGNFSSCFFVEAEVGEVKVMDLHGNLRSIKLPMTVAELMLEELGHVVSDINELKSTCRFSAMKAEEQLSTSKVYVLVPIARLNCKLSESDMTLLERACPKGRSRRHSSKVLPAMVKESCEMPSCSVRLPSGDNTCRLYSGRVRQWRPALDSISEV